MTATLEEPKRMQCMEVWGGNHAVDTGVIMAGLDAWLYSRPCDSSEAGGDIHYVSSCAAGMITRLLVADVCGHGPAVSTVASDLRKLMRKYINYHDQTKFIRAINSQFATLPQKPGSFATAVVITFEAPKNQLLLCSAGHPPPVILRAGSKRWESLTHHASRDTSSSNIPLGIEESDTYEEQLDTRLKTGDLVLCYTDSLPESRDRHGELLGTQGVIDTLNNLDCSNPARIIPQILDALPSIDSKNLHSDDVTLLLFRPNGLRPYVPFLARLKAPFNLLLSYFRPA